MMRVPRQFIYECPGGAGEALPGIAGTVSHTCIVFNPENGENRLSEADINLVVIDRQNTQWHIHDLPVSLLKRRQKEGAGRPNLEGISSLLELDERP
jgi:hypothetical protein